MSEPNQKRQKTDGEGEVVVIDNWIDGRSVAPISGMYMDVTSPHNGQVIGRVALSNDEDVKNAVESARKAQLKWAALTIKHRASLMIKIFTAIQAHTEELAEIIVKEHGKTKQEAIASIAKGNETVEWAIGLPQQSAGSVLEVSRGVECKDFREPLGVCASIVPFNFPIMVPMWTLPISITAGNAMILKPSEKVPMTAMRMAKIMQQCGLPDGILNIVNGTVAAVNALCDHPHIKAVSFVGSSPVAELVAKRCRALNKRALCLGGAKNHMVALPDCNLQMCAQDIVNSYSGCSGQRCMAASVLINVTKQSELVAAIVDKSKQLEAGSGPKQIGPIIDQASLDRITRFIDQAEKAGVQVLLDGRTWTKKLKHTGGFWIGPTILFHTNKDDPAMKDEIFGPVLSIYECKDREEAIMIENENPYGNAACIYTSQGTNAEWFCKRFSAGMLGVNIGVPVPREPFSFGGINRSKFGDFDITGSGCLEFFTQRKKVTTKWGPPKEQDWMS
eukprot:gb/GEZN01002354.1/.p1 GENE.gb/GEZN01002354.1/~~gb/GEZN01002354.1/.p1  ORF type:complete len:504 (+),score=49.67 gb/GEZN01002354.1/:325-1836(+)